MNAFELHGGVIFGGGSMMPPPMNSLLIAPSLIYMEHGRLTELTGFNYEIHEK